MYEILLSLPDLDRFKHLHGNSKIHQAEALPFQYRIMGKVVFFLGIARLK